MNPRYLQGCYLCVPTLWRFPSVPSMSIQPIVINSHCLLEPADLAPTLYPLLFPVIDPLLLRCEPQEGVDVTLQGRACARVDTQSCRVSPAAHCPGARKAGPLPVCRPPVPAWCTESSRCYIPGRPGSQERDGLRQREALARSWSWSQRQRPAESSVERDSSRRPHPLGPWPLWPRPTSPASAAGPAPATHLSVSLSLALPERACAS